MYLLVFKFFETVVETVLAAVLELFFMWVESVEVANKKIIISTEDNSFIVFYI